MVGNGHESLATPFLVTFTIKLLEVYSTGVKAIGRITVPRKTVSPPPPRRGGEDPFRHPFRSFPIVVTITLLVHRCGRWRGTKSEEIRAFWRALVSGTCETVRLEWTIRPDTPRIRKVGGGAERKKRRSFARSMALGAPLFVRFRHGSAPGAGRLTSRGWGRVG